MGDFAAIEACFQAVVRELIAGALIAFKPVLVVHLIPEVTGGYTNVEERAFQEAAAGAGVRSCVVISGRPPLSDAQVAEAVR